MAWAACSKAEETRMPLARLLKIKQHEKQQQQQLPQRRGYSPRRSFLKDKEKTKKNSRCHVTIV